MDDAAIPVPLWPDAAPAADARWFVIGVPTAPEAPRERARLQLRRVARELLAPRLGLAADAVPLLSAPGHPLCLAAPHAHIGLSAAHEPGLSLLAIDFDGAVGVDLMALASLPADWPRVAHDYLGPARAAQICAVPAAARDAAFLQAWTNLEARFKLRGEALREWLPGDGDESGGGDSLPLALPPGFVGTLVRQRAA